ncbi:hypothetical protein XELAEV_18009639mg [Xenopus laevis]|uniref:Uncharacterized protein n=1 Tax=Xenopus laevis TaxID=8355 RepID=A0A974DT41_XENLA|nr:hypothetical protein XELAEV_18009639mg [Xenopus laevis]
MQRIKANATPSSDGGNALKHLSDSRCNVAEGTLLHRFWSCPVLQDYWARIQKRITTILGFEIPLDPKWYILGMDPPNQLTRPAKNILHKILFQARRLIAQVWKSQLPPLYTDWEKSVQNMCNVEQLIARRNNTSDKCMQIWQLWILENV